MSKINIAEILKDCPTGMELDCTMYDNVQFDTVQSGNVFPIKINTPEGRISLSKYGCYSLNPQCKCIIFPKGKTTWEGFQRPFKDGDVVVCVEDNEEGKEEATQILILKSQTNESRGFCYTGYDFRLNKFFNAGNWNYERLATEEEKQKLFDAIKANGYEWNAETKTLEKFVEPIFEVGNKIEKCGYRFTIAEVKEDCYLTKCGNKIPIDNQDDFSLVPNKFDITTLKAFDRVLTRAKTGDVWGNDFFGYYKDGWFHCSGHIAVHYCIPYENNEHLLGTTNDCDEYYKTWE